MPATEMTVIIAIVAGLALGFIALLRLLNTLIVHRTIRNAVASDPQHTEAVLARLTARREGAGEDRLAIVLVALGVAMVGAALIAVDDPGDMRAAIGAALFPLLVGGALWLRWRATVRARARDQGQ
jgi:hypothetical protein